MANKNTYQLYIHIDGDVAESVDDSIAKSKKEGTGAVTAMTAYHVVQPFLSTAEQIIQNDVKTYVGSEQVSQRLGIAMDLINKSIGVGANIAGGASLASALGFGTGTGAIIGMAVSVVKEALNIFQKYREIENKRVEESESLSILRGRAGIQYNRSRGGE